MAIEVRYGPVNIKEKQICGGCHIFVNSINVLPGGIVMVSPYSASDRKSGYGGNEYFGKIYIPFDKAVAIKDKHGIVHFQVPIGLLDILKEIKGEIPKIYFDILAHDLKPLP